MANYIFETMSASDAASFTANDYLIFVSGNATATNVSVASRSATGLTTSGTDLTYNGKTLTFPDQALSQASGVQAAGTPATANHIVFNDGSQLLIGTSGANTLTSMSNGGANTAGGRSAVLFGLDGSDSIVGSATGNDYLYGGIDNTTTAQATGPFTTAGLVGDTITAGNGNNHIYGNSLTSQQGAIDGNDSIVAGGGTNYINGNAGNDFIQVGTNATSGGAVASVGANRVFGGSGNDSIVILGNGNNNVNGNTGNDRIDASNSHITTTGTGISSEILRGGAGNDTILASQGQDLIMGDTGTDSLVAGTGTNHITTMTGGDGSDTFDFSAADAGYAGTGFQGVAVFGTSSTYGYQQITDFQQGVDHIHLGFTVTSNTGIINATPGATFTTVQAAETYAQQQLNNSGSDFHTVAAVNVNGNAYLFYNAAGTSHTVDSVIQLTGVNASTLSQTSTAGAAANTFS